MQKRRQVDGRAPDGGRKVACSTPKPGVSSLCSLEIHLRLIAYWIQSSLTKDLLTKPQKGVSCNGVVKISWVSAEPHERRKKREEYAKYFDYLRG